MVKVSMRIHPQTICRAEVVGGSERGSELHRIRLRWIPLLLLLQASQFSIQESRLPAWHIINMNTNFRHSRLHARRGGCTGGVERALLTASRVAIAWRGRIWRAKRYCPILAGIWKECGGQTTILAEAIQVRLVCVIFGPGIASFMDSKLMGVLVRKVVIVPIAGLLCWDRVKTSNLPADVHLAEICHERT